MKVKFNFILLFALALAVTAIVVYYALKLPPCISQYSFNSSFINLPAPKSDSDVSVEQALFGRQSIRDYKNEPLSIAEVSQLLWSAQGLNREWGRTAPSAGATYPLETYVVVGLVDSLPAGLYHYLPLNHSLEKISDGDIREGLADCSLNQRWVEDAAVDIVFAAEYSRTTNTYGKRGERYVHMEAGHAAQNVYLQCVSLKCGTVVVGAFDDICIKNLLSLPESQEPLYVMPVGRI